MKFTDFLEKTEGLLRKKKNGLYRQSDPHFREVERWYQEDPRGLKRSEFEFLRPDSIVFDLGGYLGEWTSNLFSRYMCNIHIFEPVKEYADIIGHRFAKNPKIKVVRAGLASGDRQTLITLDEFESKVVESDQENLKTETISLIGFERYLTQHNIDRVELVKINIEGAEYELLEFLIDSGLIEKIDHLLIQFHNWEENAVSRRNKIRENLSGQYAEVFNYPFVWESWRRK